MSSHDYTRTTMSARLQRTLFRSVIFVCNRLVIVVFRLCNMLKKTTTSLSETFGLLWRGIAPWIANLNSQ